MAPLLLHPERSFGTNELIRFSGSGIGAGQEQLRKLIDAGVVRVSQVGNQRRIQANREFPLYPELRAICLKSFGLTEAIKDALKPFGDGIQESFVFGSLAKGTDKADSDIDLMVIGTADLMEINDAIYKLSQQIGREIHINKHTPDGWLALQGDRIVQHILSEPILKVLP